MKNHLFHGQVGFLILGWMVLGIQLSSEAKPTKSETLVQAQAVSVKSRALLAADIEALQSTDTGSAFQWGYGYKRLLEDLALWRQSPYVQIDSIGASVQGRAIWKITVQEGDSAPRSRIYMHARTHPAEVQAGYVAIAGLNFLLDSTEEAQRLRRSYIYHFIPMYNPDGVEVGFPRENADTVNLEVNWNHENPEPEVLALRADFEKAMADSSRIEVALNLHSDRVNCTRFFFYHDSAGTSPFYTQLEKTFIGDVKTQFPEGIEAWHFVKSWADRTHTEYPEGWWWTHYQDSVMALTYEDTNDADGLCPDASNFEKTGRALVVGAANYLERNHVAIRFSRQGSQKKVFRSAYEFSSFVNDPMEGISVNILGARLPNTKQRLSPLRSYKFFKGAGVGGTP